MRVKYQLIIGGERYNVPNSEIENWDAIKCSYKRNDIGGVVRSFSSSFVFVGHARDLLMSLYLDKGIMAKASIAIYTIDNNWRWHEQFVADFDMTSIKLGETDIGISCIDNSIEALIKANKSTKYEFQVGKDIPVDCTLDFPRLPLVESSTYEFTQDAEGANNSDGSLSVMFIPDDTPWVGRIGEPEIVNGGAIYSAEDQKPIASDSDAGFCIKNEGSYGPLNVTLDYEFRISRLRISGAGHISLVKISASGVRREVAKIVPDTAINKIETNGTVFFYEALSPENRPTHAGQFCIVKGVVYESYEAGGVAEAGQTGDWYWRSTGISESDSAYSTLIKGSTTVYLGVGESLSVMAIKHDNEPNAAFTRTFLAGQKMMFHWQIPAGSLILKGISPKQAAEKILSKICGNSAVEVSISDYDPRIAKTFLFAAESIRQMPKAKFYSSFSSFCGWMEAVFGYVYVGESGIVPPKYAALRAFYGRLRHLVTDVDSITVHPERVDVIPEASKIFFYQNEGKFVYMPDESNAYIRWIGSDDYNTGTGARTDVLFYSVSMGTYSTIDADGNFTSVAYSPDDFVERMCHTVRFIHRTELFTESEPVEITDARELKMSIPLSYIYSSVNVGYKKKDYNSQSGKDEFNFNITYTTGCTATDKKLSLISDYRADSYGVEFCAQKAGKETTDNESDQDVFFILCEPKTTSGAYSISHAITITGALSDRVFNGAFNPRMCAVANKEYIAMAKGPSNMVLSFASSDGNTDIAIDGVSLSADIEISDALATCAELEFSSISSDTNPDFTIPRIVNRGGYRYTGYLMEMSVEHARNGAIKYKLLVKDIKPC